MYKIRILIFTFIFSIIAIATSAQTPSFTYQGKLSDSSLAANGTYQFQFKLFDAPANGSQVGQTLADVPATVTNGIFAVSLDFGVSSFDGNARFLEISVRAGSGQPYTLLTPRQQVMSTPYAVKALNAAQANIANDTSNLGGIAANQYVLTTDPRLNQTPGNYIQNGTSLQSTSNFNISGEGKADKFTAVTQYNLGINRVLASSNGNLFVGYGTGSGGASGGLNTFVGNNAGMNTTSGTRNTFTGSGAGIQNTIGNDNSFFGSGSGLSNTGGDNNSFFGSSAGNVNTGDNNAFFGYESGKANTTAGDNSFFGTGSGKANTTGSKNSFFGRNAGTANTIGNFNSFYGNASGQSNTTGIGNSFYGDSAGLLNNTGGNNSFFGKGAGLVSTTGSNNVFLGYSTGINNTSGSNNTLIGANAQVMGQLQFATAIGAGAVVDASNLIVLGRDQGQDAVWTWGKTVAFGGLTLGTMQAGASFALCGGGGSGTSIGFCSSSIRYKENIENYTRGLDLISKLRPVTFNWKSSGQRDLGFVAEEVGEVEPLLNVVYNGRIEGVKYAQITTALVNAVKEQQDQIRQLQTQIDTLKSLICQSNPSAAVVCQK
jgi:hypothetical protein